MFGELTAWLLELIQSHGILAVVLGVVIETIIVPLPSPLILMTAGFVLIPHGPLLSIVWTALWISIVAGIAQTIGSYMLYFIGYYGGKPIITKYEKLHGVSWTDIQKFEKKFSKKNRQNITLAMMRALPIMPLSVISGVAGILKMDFRKYTAATFLGVIPRNMSLALIGYAFSGFYETIALYFDKAETIMTVLIILLVIFYILGQKLDWFDKLRKNILK